MNQLSSQIDHLLQINLLIWIHFLVLRQINRLIRIELVLLLQNIIRPRIQDILRPRKVFDFCQLAALFHRLSQLAPLLRPEPIVPAE